MIKALMMTLCAVSIGTQSLLAYADFNPDEGRVGEVQRVPDPTDFKVCTIPDNLPYSNVKGEGFEDKIAEVLAKDLGKKVSFMPWPDKGIGWIRTTLNAMRCDVIMGISDVDMVRTSKPYYRSGYVFVYRKDSHYNIKDWDSADLKKAAIGTSSWAPTTRPLKDKGLFGNIVPYPLLHTADAPASVMIDDLAAGKIDVAIIWGPIGGYFAKKSKVPMEVVPVPEYEQANLHGKEYFNISVAVRKKDKERMQEIQGALERHKDEINKILDDYGIPRVPVVEDNALKEKD